MSDITNDRLIYRIIPAIVSLALFMEALDMTIINTAIPVMAHSLQVPAISLKIALISYLLSLAIFIPVSGWMADRFGARRVFISALTVFTIGSFWCGWSTHLWELVIARAVQGIGGAMTMPVGRLIIVRLVKRSDFMVTMNRVVIPALIGPALGPLIGGMIVERFTWPWIFWVNIPFGIITLLLAWRYLKELPRHHAAPLDIIGFILFGVGLAGLTFGFAMFSENDLSPLSVVILMLISLGLLLGYYWRARRQTHPLVNFSLFKLRTFRISILGNIGSRLGFGGMPFLLPLLLQIALGYSAQMAGALVALFAVGAMTMKTLSQRIVRRWGFKHVLMVNTLLLSASIASFATINAHTSLLMIACLTLIFGLLNSLQYSAMNPLAYAEVSEAMTGSVTSVFTTAQQLATSFGVAIAAIFLRFFAGDNIHHLTVAVFHQSLIALALITLIASFIFMQLKREDGSELYKRVEMKP